MKRKLWVVLSCSIFLLGVSAAIVGHKYGGLSYGLHGKKPLSGNNSRFEKDSLTGVLFLALELPANDFSKLLNLLEADANKPLKEAIVPLVLSRWIQPDPMTTWASANNIEHVDRRFEMASRTAQAWANYDRESLAAYLDACGDEKQKQILLKAHLMSWAAKDPAEAMRWADARLSQFDCARLHTDILLSWGAVDPSAAGRYLINPKSKATKMAIRLFAQQWAMTGSSECITWALQFPKENEEVLASIIDGILAGKKIHNAEEAESLISQFPQGFHRVLACRRACLSLLQANAAEALDFLQTLPPSSQHSTLHCAFKNWAKEEPDQAVEAFLGRSEFVAVPESGKGLMDGLLVSDPGKAVELLVSRLGSLADVYLPPVMHGWMSQELDAVKQFVLSIKGEAMRDRCLGLLVNYWGSFEPESTCKWALGLADAGMQRKAFELLLPFADRVSFESANAVMAKIPASKLKDAWLGAFILRYSPEKSVELMAWINQLPEGRSKIAALKAGAEVWAKQDPKSAIEYFHNMRDQKLQAECFRIIARTWARSDASSALGWSMSLTNNRVKNELIPIIVRETALADLPASVALMNQLTSEEQKTAALQAVLPVYVDHDPNSAAKWLTEFPKSTLRNQALNRFTRIWGLKDPQATSAWMSGLSPEDKKTIIPAFVRSVDGSRPDLAAFAANELTDEKERVEWIARSVMRWGASNADAATSWLATVPLPETDRSKIMEMLNQGQEF